MRACSAVGNNKLANSFDLLSTVGVAIDLTPYLDLFKKKDRIMKSSRPTTSRMLTNA